MTVPTISPIIRQRRYVSSTCQPLSPDSPGPGSPPGLLEEVWSSLDWSMSQKTPSLIPVRTPEPDFSASFVPGVGQRPCPRPGRESWLWLLWAEQLVPDLLPEIHPCPFLVPRSSNDDTVLLVVHTVLTWWTATISQAHPGFLLPGGKANSSVESSILSLCLTSPGSHGCLLSFWYPQQESNPYSGLRRPASYPLNDGDIECSTVWIATGITAHQYQTTRIQSRHPGNPKGSRTPVCSLGESRLIHWAIGSYSCALDFKPTWAIHLVFR